MRGKEPLGETRLVSDSYQVEPDRVERLREIARRVGRSKASLIREAVEWLLKKYGAVLED